MYTQPYPEDGQGPTPAQRNNAAPNSLLVADCGAVFTKVSLFGLVEGQYRLIARGEAPTTAKSPSEDITEGVMQAINTIEFITGRQLLEEKKIVSPEDAVGNGVDIFIATASVSDPLRLSVLGSISPLLEKLTALAVSGLYTQVQMVPSPSYTAAMASSTIPVNAGAAGGATPLWTQERVAMEWDRQVARIRELQPQVALIVGAADGPAGPTSLQEACQLLINAARDTTNNSSALQENDAKQYSVVYAGAPQYLEAVRRMLKGVGEVTRVEPLVSSSQLGSVSTVIGALHERISIQQLPGYDRLHSWSSAPPVATATSLSSLVRFLAQHYAMNVTAVDVGGGTTTVMIAGEQGEFIPTVNTTVGVGANIGDILHQVGLQRVTRWLPFSITEDEVRQFVLNHMLHPQDLPADSRELSLMQAFAREAIALTIEGARKNGSELPESDLILATGGVLSHAPKYGQVAMMLLDAIQPRGVTSLVLDRTMLIPQLGAVATVAPVTAVQVNENDAVSHRLGTCVIPFGNVQPGQLAVRVGVEYSNGRQMSIDVTGGSIEVIPLQVNEQALLTLFPAPTVDVGLGPGERARAAEEIDGGLIGLIIDARGRPLILPSDEMERQARLLQWSQVLGA